MPRPSLKQFLELPITVQHAYDAYPLVDSALADLEQGQFSSASMLTDAVYTDDRVAGIINTRLNAVDALDMDFKWQGQDEQEAKEKAEQEAKVPQSVAVPSIGGKPVPAGAPPPPPPPAPTQKPAQARADRRDVYAAALDVQTNGDDDERANEDDIIALKQTILKCAEDHWEQMFPGSALKETRRWGLFVNAGVGELVWSVDPNDGNFYPTLKTWNSQFLYWRWDTRSYWLIHQGGQTEVFPGDGRWVLFAPTGHNHGWLYGLIRALAPLWIDRRFAWKDWARASEKWSVGIVKAKIPAGASPESVARFEGATTNMPSEGTVYLPQLDDGKGGFDLETLKSDGMTGWENFSKRIETIDTSMAVCVLGQNLTTEIKGQGSRAAAQVHENIRADVLKADCEIEDNMVESQILGPWVRYNWSDEASRLGVDWRELVPEIRHVVDPPANKVEDSTALYTVAQAAQLFSQMPDVDVRAVLDQQGVPLREKELIEQQMLPVDPSVNERPRAPGGNEGDTLTPNARGADAPGVTQPLEVASRTVHLALPIPKGLKKNARKGQVIADQIADEGKQRGKAKVADRKAQLLHICKTVDSYDDMRRQVKELYHDATPIQLRDIIERALITAELVGRMATHGDTLHG